MFGLQAMAMTGAVGQITFATNMYRYASSHGNEMEVAVLAVLLTTFEEKLDGISVSRDKHTE